MDQASDRRAPAPSGRRADAFPGECSEISRIPEAPIRILNEDKISPRAPAPFFMSLATAVGTMISTLVYPLIIWFCQKCIERTAQFGVLGVKDCGSDTLRLHLDASLLRHPAGFLLRICRSCMTAHLPSKCVSLFAKHLAAPPLAVHRQPRSSPPERSGSTAPVLGSPSSGGAMVVARDTDIWGLCSFMQTAKCPRRTRSTSSLLEVNKVNGLIMFTLASEWKSY